MTARMKSLITRYVNARIAMLSIDMLPLDEWAKRKRAVERAWANLERYVEARG